MKQIKLYDMENEVFAGGILLPEGDVICGCCGGIIPQDEICTDCKEVKIKYEKIKKENCTHRIVEVFKNWVDLTETIIGE